MPKFDDESGMELKWIDINDDPLEDILVWLGEGCDWIDEHLRPSVVEEEGEKGSEEMKRERGVLVHCTQGISRSGSFVIAYRLFPFFSSLPSSPFGLKIVADIGSDASPQNRVRRRSVSC